MNQKLVVIISTVYVLFMATLSIFYQINGDSYKSLVALGGVICGALPLLLALLTKQSINLSIILSYFLFLFGSQYLGSILNWYGLGWWDTFIHFISGSILAFIGISLFNKWTSSNTKNKISAWFIFFFPLSFATIGGVFWEIYEFSFDTFFDMTLQGGGNKDTMTDLIADTLGGLTIAVWTGFRTNSKNK